MTQVRRRRAPIGSPVCLIERWSHWENALPVAPMIERGREMLETLSTGTASVPANTTILFFGAISDQLGRSHRVYVPVGGVSPKDLAAIIDAQFPDAGAALARPGVRAAIDQVLVIDDAHVHPGADVAFFSAFSGG